MKRFSRIGCFALALTAALPLTGCSGGGGGGFLGINPGPDGNIKITDATSGAVLTTSAGQPDMVTGSRFAIGIYENHFGGPYSITNVGIDNVPTAANGNTTYHYKFNYPCFGPHFQNDPNSQTNVVTFISDQANGQPYANLPSGAGSGNPCHSGLLETWAISDSKGHTAYFYDEEV